MYTPFDNAVHDLYKMRDIVDGRSQTRQSKVCGFCKTQQEDYEETYFVGCPACYNAFNEEIKKACVNIHGSSKHIGKVPQKFKTTAGKLAEIQVLESQKQHAVDNEDYELAGRIKKKIEKMRGEIYGY